MHHLLAAAGFPFSRQGAAQRTRLGGGAGRRLRSVHRTEYPARVLGLPPAYTALRHTSVYGDVIEVPLAAAGLSAMGSSAMRIRPQPSRYARGYLAAGSIACARLSPRRS